MSLTSQEKLISEDIEFEDSSSVSQRDQDTGQPGPSTMSLEVSGLGSGQTTSESSPKKSPPKRSKGGKTRRTKEKVEEKAPQGKEKVKEKKTSGEQLRDLARPKVFEGPQVDLQKQIVVALEKAIPLLDEQREKPRKRVEAKLAKLEKTFDEGAQHSDEEWKIYNAKRQELRKQLPPEKDQPLYYLGSIVLDRIPADPKLDQELIDEARLTKTDNALGDSQDGTGLIEIAQIEGDVVRNTLETMIKAGQMDYLRASGFVGAKWKVVVEVHYYRRRSKQQANLHKDTLGQTMFVNLNYTNDVPLPGPEFVVNPPLHDTHEQKLRESMPDQFLQDLQGTRDLPKPKVIETTIVPPNGVVAFVDETIHHATPLLGHREVRIDKLRRFLVEDPDFAPLYPLAKKAYDKSVKKPSGLFKKFQKPKEFASLFDTQLSDQEKERWRALMELCSGADDFKVNRPTLLTLGMKRKQVDRLLSGYGPDTFNQVNIPGRARKDGGTGRLPMTTDPEGTQPIKLSRRMSMLALDDQLPVDPGGDRRFFRTWVRAVRVKD